MTESESTAPNPFLIPRFWLLVANTILMKWQHRRRGAHYTELLTRFYTRHHTHNVEAYGDAYAEVRPILVEKAGPLPGERVLDVATGGGYQAAAFAGAGCSTVGLDYVLDRARLACEQHGLNRLAWMSGDATRLPFATNAFDLVTISLALHDMPLDVQMGALREMCRIARRRVVIVEPRAPEGQWLWRQFYITVGDLIDESLHFADYVQRDFDTHLEKAGLRLIEQMRTFHGLLVVYVCEPVENA